MIEKNEKDILHHINESNKLIIQTRFTIDEMREKLDFIMGDLWILLDRNKSIEDEVNPLIKDMSLDDYANLTRATLNTTQ